MLQRILTFAEIPFGNQELVDRTKRRVPSFGVDGNFDPTACLSIDLGGSNWTKSHGANDTDVGTLSISALTGHVELGPVTVIG